MKRLLVLFCLFILTYFVDTRFVGLKNPHEEMIEVEISGAVENPGFYTLHSYTTIKDLLTLATPLESADLRSINANTTLHNHDKIIIPYIDENIVKISINTANLESLMMLPGIGEKTALAIIEYRETNGLYQEIEDIMNVKGIGEKKYEKIEPYISL